MDLYFIVAELTFPPGGAARWRGAPLAPRGLAIDDVLREAEGPTRLSIDGERVSLRAYLVDGAYFLVRTPLEAALGAAGAAGARGAWYSGDHVSGRHAALPGAAKAAKLHTLPQDVQRWTREAVELDAPAPIPGRLALSPVTGARFVVGAPASARAKGRPAARKPAKKAAKKSAKKPAKAAKKPAKRR